MRLWFAILFLWVGLFSFPASAAPSMSRLKEIIEYSKKNFVCEAGLENVGLSLDAQTVNVRGSRYRLHPLGLGHATLVEPMLEPLGKAGISELLLVGNHKFTQFSNGAVINLAIYDGENLIGTGQIANTNFEKLPLGNKVANGEKWAEISYQLHPNYKALTEGQENVEVSVVKALTQIAFEKLGVAGVHSQHFLNKTELETMWRAHGLADSLTALPGDWLNEEMAYTFSMSRMEYVATNEALAESPKAITIPNVNFPDMVTDAVTLAQMNEIKDRKAREDARAQYYPAPVTTWKKWMAAGGLAIAGIFGFELVSTYLQDPTIFKTLAAIPAFIAGVFVADYANSEFHWGLDNTFYNSKNPFLISVARDARIHHEDPQACLRNTYLGRLSEIGPVAIAGFLSLTAVLKYALVGGVADQALSMVGVPKGSFGNAIDFTSAAFLGSFLLAGWHGTITHQMAHDPKPPWIWRQLQRLSLSISRKRHMDHHTPPYDNIYSTQTGWIDWLHSREYWQRRMRRYYESTGVMPGTWIQDPRAIPEDIRAKLVAEFETKKDSIPMHLWAYAPKAYPKRVPAELVEPLKFVQEKWRVDFIERRKVDFTEMAKVNPRDAQEQWIEEQIKFPWIYGPVPQPLHFPAKKMAHEGSSR